ncbi:complex I NDUFA9 subunit family protein [Sneathiella limimaris]|uniref:complex I NDUFA9 subunit family protein n=1 Tax=Sneathiella limimaris TaxID=1964213 RepID=UPI00146C53EF|nr:complex I NDUFA9 subunit family protein [Sneathiella limimaris]
MSSSLITIIGGSGFIGHHLVGRLAAQGHQIRIAVRDTERAAVLMTQGNVGQVVGMQTNIRNRQSIERAVAGADIVINLVGLLSEAGAQSFEKVHVEGAAMVAEAAKAAGAKQFMQMSALGADLKSPSKYARTKAEGEARVSEVFPGATIIRPSVVFGNDDSFTLKFGQMATLSPILPLLNGGKNLMQPIWIEDLVDAMTTILGDASLQGKIYEFGGAEQLSLADIIGRINEVTRRSVTILPTPESAMKVMAFFMSLLPGEPPLTLDQVKLLKTDNIVTGEYPGLADLGIEPVHFTPATLAYLKRFRKGGGLNELHA